MDTVAQANFTYKLHNANSWTPRHPPQTELTGLTGDTLAGTPVSDADWPRAESYLVCHTGVAVIVVNVVVHAEDRVGWTVFGDTAGTCEGQALGYQPEHTSGRERQLTCACTSTEAGTATPVRSPDAWASGVGGTAKAWGP
jgi:hypothetical protein